MLAKVVAIIAGLLCAGAAEYVAYALAAGGEGWIAPAAASLLLFLVYPAAFWRLASEPSRVQLDYALLAAAVISDLLLIGETIAWEAAYFAMIMANFPGFVFLWIALWSGWQLLTVRRIVRQRMLESY